MARGLPSCCRRWWFARPMAPARDTDWMDGFYPYHEMNTYMGLIAIVLAVVGAGGPGGARPLVELLGLADRHRLACSMLGKFTFLFDYAHRLPILGSSREPVRFHVWVSLGVAALAATGVERLGRPGVVSLRHGLILAGILVAVSIPIMIYHLLPGLDSPDDLDPDISPRPLPLARPRAQRSPRSGPGSWPCARGGSRRRPRARFDPDRRARLGRDPAASGPRRPLECALGRRSHGRSPLTGPCRRRRRDG